MVRAIQDGFTGKGSALWRARKRAEVSGKCNRCFKEKDSPAKLCANCRGWMKAYNARRGTKTGGENVGPENP